MLTTLVVEHECDHHVDLVFHDLAAVTAHVLLLDPCARGHCAAFLTLEQFRLNPAADVFATEYVENVHLKPPVSEPVYAGSHTVKMATNPSPLRGLINSETAAGEDGNVDGLSHSSLRQTDFRTAGQPVVVDCDPPCRTSARKDGSGKGDDSSMRRRLAETVARAGRAIARRLVHSHRRRRRLAWPKNRATRFSFATALTMALLERAGSPNTRPSGSKSGCLQASYSRMIRLARVVKAFVPGAIHVCRVP